MAEVISDRDEWMRRTGPFYPGLVALWSLSAAPPPRGLSFTDEDRLRSAAWFPLVGGLMGLILAGLAALALRVHLAPLVAVVLVAAVAPLMTRARPERGLARTLDGQDGALRGIGAAGVLALVCFTLLRAAGLGGASTGAWLGALVTAHMSARWAIVFLLTIGERVPGTAAASAAATSAADAGHDREGGVPLPRSGLSFTTLGVATGITVLIAVIAAGTTGFLSLLAVAAVAFAAGLYAQRRLGGLSDRALAAVACGCEVTALLCFAAAYPALLAP